MKNTEKGHPNKHNSKAKKTQESLGSRKAPSTQDHSQNEGSVSVSSASLCNITYIRRQSVH